MNLVNIGARVAWMVGIVLLPALGSGAHAAPSASRLYAPCVVCHQPGAWGSPDGLIPNLAGQRKHYLEKQLTLFKSGARVDPSMQVVTAHPTFDDPRNVAALAGYLSQLTPNPRPVQGAGAHLRVGQELYAHICAACHGVLGLGADLNAVPRLAGQHFPYLRRQIDSAAAWHRELAPPEMTSALRSMRDSEKDALADYISRLTDGEPLDDAGRDPRHRGAN